MQITFLKTMSLFLLSINVVGIIYPNRSIHRPVDTTMPSISTYWQHNKTQHYTMKSPYLEAYPFFEIYDETYLRKFHLPTEITFRYNKAQKIQSSILNKRLEKLVQEVNLKTTVYSDFTIIRETDFNRNRRSGCIILEDKTYPFVVKLFTETPDSFVKPYRKGFYPMFFYIMGGGINRHLSGLTRIKNAQDIQAIISANPYWASRVDIPRKWFWTPENVRMITIVGENIGRHNHITTNIPSTYCIVADAIEIERSMTLVNAEDRIESMALCNTAKYMIDPHIDNFMIEKNTNKIILVDTEHFPSMVGFKKEIREYTSQTAWYLDLSLKCANDMFFRDKERRHME